MTHRRLVGPRDAVNAVPVEAAVNDVRVSGIGKHAQNGRAVTVSADYQRRVGDKRDGAGIKVQRITANVRMVVNDSANCGLHADTIAHRASRRKYEKCGDGGI